MRQPLVAGKWNIFLRTTESGIFFTNHYGQKFNPYLLSDESSIALNHEFIQLLLTGQEAPIADKTAHFARPVPTSARYSPIYSSGFFTMFVVIPIIMICLMIYLS